MYIVLLLLVSLNCNTGYPNTCNLECFPYTVYTVNTASHCQYYTASHCQDGITFPIKHHIFCTVYVSVLTFKRLDQDEDKADNLFSKKRKKSEEEAAALNLLPKDEVKNFVF